MIIVTSNFELYRHSHIYGHHFTLIYKNMKFEYHIFYMKLRHRSFKFIAK